MDADNIQFQKSTPDTDDAVDDSASDSGLKSTVDSHGDQVFDITDDLTISPAKGIPATEPLPTTTQPQQAMDMRPDASVGARAQPMFKAADPYLMEPLSTGGPAINQFEQPARKIPLQEFPSALAQNRTAPANPPAKTIGGTGSLEERPDLQSAVAPIAHPGTSLNNPNVKSIRTYESDVAELMSRTRTSAATITIAESKRDSGQERIAIKSEPPREPSHAFKNFLLIVISLLLIGGGSYGAYYLYLRSAIAPSAPTQSGPQESGPKASAAASGIVPTDFTVVLPIDGLNAGDIISRIQAEADKPLPNNDIKEIVPVALKNGNEERVMAPDMLAHMGIPVPNILSRSQSANWMLGIYADPTGQKTAFVISTNSFFQNAFAGMLQWEGMMPSDLKQYLFPGATSTTTVRGQFTNKIIHNKDVREFVAANGQVLFLYSFIDSGTLVIAGSESALSEILTRLEKLAYLR